MNHVESSKAENSMQYRCNKRNQKMQQEKSKTVWHNAYNSWCCIHDSWCYMGNGFNGWSDYDCTCIASYIYKGSEKAKLNLQSKSNSETIKQTECVMSHFLLFAALFRNGNTNGKLNNTVLMGHLCKSPIPLPKGKSFYG